MEKDVKDKSTLHEDESHPMAYAAKSYVVSLGFEKLLVYQEAFSSCAIENNRLAEICGDTLRRLLSGDPVSDRYMLGLAWYLKECEEYNDEN